MILAQLMEMKNHHPNTFFFTACIMTYKSKQVKTITIKNNKTVPKPNHNFLDEKIAKFESALTISIVSSSPSPVD